MEIIMINLYHKYFYKLYYCFNNVNLIFNNKILKYNKPTSESNLHVFKDTYLNIFVIDFYNAIKLNYFTLTKNEDSIIEKKFKYIPDFKSFCKIIFKNV